MEIIEKGKKRVFKCIHCECVFKTVKYKKVDDEEFTDVYFEVTCPECENNYGLHELDK